MTFGPFGPWSTRTTRQPKQGRLHHHLGLGQQETGQGRAYGAVAQGGSEQWRGDAAAKALWPGGGGRRPSGSASPAPPSSPPMPPLPPPAASQDRNTLSLSLSFSTFHQRNSFSSSSGLGIDKFWFLAISSVCEL
uniref:Uncharacterized protein n=1 Tax=Aegilops tauschii subsp. strangulata TaxID=200361 RepID=A0A453KKH1_AEGTS